MAYQYLLCWTISNISGFLKSNCLLLHWPLLWETPFDQFRSVCLTNVTGLKLDYIWVMCKLGWLVRFNIVYWSVCSFYHAHYISVITFKNCTLLILIIHLTYFFKTKFKGSSPIINHFQGMNIHSWVGRGSLKRLEGYILSIMFLFKAVGEISLCPSCLVESWS